MREGAPQGRGQARDDRLEAVATCQKPVADCVQLKPGGSECVGSATTKCSKLFASAGAAADTLPAALGKPCAAATTSLGPAAGLGFDADAEACAERGVASIATLPEVPECVGRRQACAVDRVLGATVPRAAELLTLAGRSPSSELPCLTRRLRDRWRRRHAFTEAAPEVRCGAPKSRGQAPRGRVQSHG